ncbi:MAG TPA: Plug domain-containing protein, partial [Gemmataceae bacterium]|nr:Plug domain-containing protein [Gemmataceae bacterium]
PATPTPAAAPPQVAGGNGAPDVAAGPTAPPQLASQMTISGADLNTRPVTRPGELLEAVPGLAVTQHSGEGKANQYFLRGYNLDHGTDLAITVDDMPINMRTQAHGQGYADPNFLMPETVNSLDIRKGPYFADVGDFGSVGALSIGLLDTTPKKTATLTVGSFGYERLFGMGSTQTADGHLFFAGEVSHYDGPWNNPDDARKINGLVRYTLGTADNGLRARPVINATFALDNTVAQAKVGHSSTHLFVDGPLASRAWPIPTSGTQPTRCRCAQSTRG